MQIPTTIERHILAYLFALSVSVLPLALWSQQVPAPDVSDLALPSPTSTKITPLLLKSKGQVNVWVELANPALARAHASAKASGKPLTRDEQHSYHKLLRDKQAELSAAAASMGARELGHVTKAHNAVAFSVDAAMVPVLAAHAGVVAVRPVIDYTVSDISETVGYIGATAVQNLGVTGKGVRVAVLDSGIDYTHRDLGGSGTAADYTAAFGTSLDDPRNKTINPALFPTKKVVGGYDFVGEHWPHGPLAPDPNPIPCAIPSICDGTHGTHVSDILAGASLDGTHKGVAPGAQLYAVKVCSSVSTACSGVAVLQGMDFALDPDGDNDLEDKVDVINMSLGQAYGMNEDDLTQAAENAVHLGVVVVTAAGNNGNLPYVVSSPSIGPGIISVAQTQVPSALFYPLVVNSPASIAGSYTNTATVDWAPVGNGFMGNVVYIGRGCPAGSIAPGSPEDPYPTGVTLTGNVFLIDRGACAVSLKVDRAANAGALGVLLALSAPGDPFSFSFGGGTTFVPTLIITQSAGNAIRQALTTAPVNVTVHNSFPLQMSMVSSSARGPSYSYQTIKPEIGAPGASISAVAGTGTAEAAFGGTSGATPMVAGSAALLLEARPHASPTEIKSRLMNNAETQIFTAPNLLPGELAPATRIGGGEVRVDRALASKTTAWVQDDESAAVSFGYAALTGKAEFRKTVTVRNFSKVARSYAVSMDFRNPNNPAVAAVHMDLPHVLHVSARGQEDFDVRIKVDPSKLQPWSLNGGSQGGNGQLLTQLELDGHITLSDNKDTIRVPWHLLPHKAADVDAHDDTVELSHGGGALTLSNHGATSGRVEVFAWTGTSKKIPNSLLPNPGDNFAVINLHYVGVRLANSGVGPVVQFGVNTFGARSHPNYPAEFDILIDSHNTGTPDFLVFNLENGGFGATGQNVTEVFNLATKKPVGIFFSTDADLNSSNAILTAPLSAVGLTPTSQFNFAVLAFDNYFTGNLTDSIENMTFSFAQPRFIGGGIPSAGVPVNGSAVLTVASVPGGDTASPSQAGFLLLYRDAAPNRDAQAIRVQGQP
jgi:minor extracellular serine protease Vpr